jgi:hypothetical protein
MSTGKGIALASCLLAAVYLGTNNHVGLAGWVLFLAFCIS